MGVIQRQSIRNFFTSYAGVAIGFVNVLVVQPRFLSPEELGLTRVLYSFSLLLSTVVPMGLSNVAIRYFPYFRHPGKKHHGFFGFLVYGTLVGFVLTAVAVFLLREYFVGRYAEHSQLFADYFTWIFPLTFFLAFITQINIYCFSLYKSTVPSFLNDVVIRLGVILLVSLYYLEWFPLPVFIMLFVGLYGLQVLLLVVYVFYEETPGFIPDKAFFREMSWAPVIRFGALLGMASFASTGLKELATVVLGTHIALDNVAVYVVAAFIPTLIEVPLNAVDKIATFNITTALAQKNMDTVAVIYRKSARYLLLIGGALFLLINANIDSLLLFLPEPYRQGAGVVFILSFATLFNMATGLNSQILVYSHKYYYGSAMIVLAVIVNFTLQVLLIPRYGIEGAALATAASGMLMNAVNTTIVWVHFRMHPVDDVTWKAIALMAMVYVADRWIPQAGDKYVDIIVHGTAVLALFGGAVFGLRLAPEMNEWLRGVVKRR